MKYSKTKRKPVVSIESGEEFSEIKKIIIDYDSRNFLGLVLKNKTVVYAEDISEFGKDAVMVRSSKELMPLKDNNQFEELMKSKVSIINNKTVTESGEELGEVKDYLIDETSHKLKKIFVSTGFFKDLFKGELIVMADKIISIGKDAIIVKDSVIPVSEKEKARKEVKGLAGAGALNKDI
jgi:uncharacterized protein YrrD